MLLHFQSEKRNQDVVAEIVLEKLHGRELPKIVRGLLPGPKSSTIAEKSSRPRKVRFSIASCVYVAGSEFVHRL